jgi:biotin transport system substrate-specific component
LSITLAIRPTIIDRVVPKGIATDLALIAAGTALTAVAAQLAIPAYPVPFTFQTLAVLLVGATLGSLRGALSMVLYAILGIAGLPVFAPKADGTHAVGLAAIVGPTFGFLLGFIVASAIIGFLAEREWSSNVFKMFASYVASSLVIYAFGIPVLANVAFAGNFVAAATYMAPFLIWDAVKALIAAGLLPLAWRGVNAIKR